MALVDRLADFREQYDIEHELAETTNVRPEASALRAATLERPDEMEEFLAEVNTVTSWISRVKTAVQKLSENYALLLVTYDHSAAKEENARLVQTITDLSRKINVKLTEIKRSLDESDRDSTNYRVKISQYHSLFCSISEVLSSYNEIQEDYKEKNRDCIQKQLSYGGKAVTEDQLSRMVEGNSLNIPLLAVSALQMKEVETRKSEMQLLEQNITELRDMFYDIALLVEEQGETVDHISKHVELAHEYVFQGNVELVEATVYKDHNRKLRWCLCGVVSSIIVLFVVAIVVIIIVITQLETNASNAA